MSYKSKFDFSSQISFASIRVHSFTFAFKNLMHEFNANDTRIPKNYTNGWRLRLVS